MAVLEGIMQLLHMPTIHIPTLLGFFQPSQLGISLHHHINRLANRVLIDLLDINLQTINGLNRQLSLCHQLTLAQRLIGIAFTLGAGPRQVALTLLVTLLMQVLDRLKSNRAATSNRQIVATAELGPLIQLVAATG